MDIHDGPALTQVNVSLLPRADTLPAHLDPGRQLMRFHVGAVILILLGVVFLLVNLDIAPAQELKALLTKWWPLLLIVAGIAAIIRPRRAS